MQLFAGNHIMYVFCCTPNSSGFYFRINHRGICGTCWMCTIHYKHWCIYGLIYFELWYPMHEVVNLYNMWDDQKERGELYRCTSVIAYECIKTYCSTSLNMHIWNTGFNNYALNMNFWYCIYITVKYKYTFVCALCVCSLSSYSSNILKMCHHHTMDMLWDKFQWILPLYMKPISFQSKASVVCSVTTAVFIDFPNILVKNNKWIPEFHRKIPKNWSVDQVSVLIISWYII